MTKIPPEKQNTLLEGPLLSSLLILAVPIVIAQILQATYQLIDAFWVGRLGANAVAAVSVTTPITFVTIALGSGLAIAGNVLIAQYAGARRQDMVDHVAAQTILMVVLVSVALSSTGFFCAPLILKLMGVTPEVYKGALGFMRVSFIGLPFNFLFIIFMAFMRGVGRPTIPLFIIMGTVTLNFLLDPIFIFGYRSIPANGVMGAAMATLSTQVLATSIGLFLLFRGRHGIKIRGRDFFPDWVYIKRALFLGLPASIEQSMRALGLTVMTFLITSFGTLALASYGVGSNVLQVVMIPAMGLSQAISTVVAQNIGAGNVNRAASIGKLGALMGFLALSALGALAFIFAPHLIAFFVPNDPEIIRGGTQFLKIMSPAWGFIGLQLALTGVLKGSGNMVISMILALVTQFVLQFPLAYVLSHHTAMGIAGLWWAFPVTNLTIALITMGVFAQGNWKKKRITAEVDQEEELAREVDKETYVNEGIR